MALGTGVLMAGCQSKSRWRPLSESELNRPIPAAQPRTAPTPQTLTGSVSGVVPRHEWTRSEPILALAKPMNGIRRITVHHSGVVSSSVRTKTDAARMLESIRSGHIGRKWADIGYHYIVDPTGRIWEGRPVRLQGAHVSEQNENNLGIMVMGNFMEERPTSEALGALDAFLAEQMRRYRVPLRGAFPYVGVYTHQEIGSSACPGTSLQSYMIATRSGSGRLARA